MKKSSTVTVYFYEEDFDLEKEIEYEVEASFYPGSPGKTWGPPEKCYPPEAADIDIISVYNCTLNRDEPEMVKRFNETGELNEEIETKAREMEEAAYEEAMEAKYDRERDDRLEDWD